MHKSTLIEIIKQFSKDDILQFTDFVNSPYFNKNKSVTKLFVEIKKIIPDFESDGLKKENIWKKIYPGKAFNYGVMKNLIHELSKLLEQYLTNEEIDEDSLLKDYKLLLSLNKRNIFRVYENKYNKIINNDFESLSKEKEFYISKYYQYFYEMKYLNYFYSSILKNKPNAHKDFLDASDYFFIGFLISMTLDQFELNRIKVSLNVLDKPDSEVYVLSEELQEFLTEKLINKILAHIKNKSERDYKIVKCYFRYYLAFNNLTDEEYYFEAKSCLEEIKHILPEIDLRLFCHNLTKIIYFSKSPKVIKINEYIYVYKTMMETDVFLEENNTLPVVKYTNYINFFIDNDEYSELEGFINKYWRFVEEEKREDVYNYSMSLLSMSKKQFEKSLEYILKMKNISSSMKHMAKLIQVRCYYELNDYESFEYLYDSFKKADYKTDMITEILHNQTLKLCEFTDMLFKLRDNLDNFRLSKLRKDFEKEKANTRMSMWLNKKISELKES